MTLLPENRPGQSTGTPDQTSDILPPKHDRVTTRPQSTLELQQGKDGKPDSFIFTTRRGSQIPISLKNEKIQAVLGEITATAVNNEQAESIFDLTDIIIDSFGKRGITIKGGHEGALTTYVTMLQQVYEAEKMQTSIKQQGVIQATLDWMMENVSANGLKAFFFSSDQRDAMSMLYRVLLVRTMQDYINDETVQTANRIVDIDKTLMNRARELWKQRADSLKEIGKGVGGTAGELVAGAGKGVGTATGQLTSNALHGVGEGIGRFAGAIRNGFNNPDKKDPSQS